jgi:hypothetical protein
MGEWKMAMEITKEQKIKQARKAIRSAQYGQVIRFKGIPCEFTKYKNGIKDEHGYMWTQKDLLDLYGDLDVEVI